jgi:hypothetical protein
LFGDIDDVLMFTSRSRGAPFVGKFNGQIIESPVAEVIYFLAQDDVNPNSLPPVIDATQSPPARLYTLYRRVLLVSPGVVPTINLTFYTNNDLSVRYDSAAPSLISNTLGDLTKRENRFAHYGNAAVAHGDFPFPVDFAAIPRYPFPATLSVPLSSTISGGSWPASRPEVNAFLAPFITDRAGDDVLLNNVLAFDVQVFDPGAPIYVENGAAIEPTDPAWPGTTSAGVGAYVDLGYTAAPGSNPSFAGTPALKSQITAPPAIYDTWSLHYENDGIDQNPSDTPMGADLGTNGLDDGTTPNGIVDDVTEFDTLPPYAAPLRGIRVKIRVYEPSSQVVREAVVIQSFLPE